MDNALRALNRAEHAIAIAGAMESGWNTMVADNRYLQSHNDELSRRLVAVEQRLRDVESLVLSLVS